MLCGLVKNRSATVVSRLGLFVPSYAFVLGGVLAVPNRQTCEIKFFNWTIFMLCHF